jgi:hypothetical protein
LEGRSRSWDRWQRSCMQRGSAQGHFVAKAHFDVVSMIVGFEL